jgi:serine phosphatase RsbU (regulator of sigma subunit)
MEDYKGGRDLDSLKDFAGTLKPICNVDTLENCDEEQKLIVSALFEESDEQLDKRIQEYEDEMASLDKNFVDFIEEFKKTFQVLSAQKATAEAELTVDSNIQLVRSVKKTLARDQEEKVEKPEEL